MSSGFEGETGLYRKGIPTIAATASTIVTFGTGSLYTGAAAGGVSNGGGNFFGQWAQTGDIYRVDGLSVALSAGGGLLKIPGVSTNVLPWLQTGITSTVDAALDFKFDGSFNVIGSSDKSWSQGMMDLGFSLGGGTQNTLLQNAGLNQSIINRRSFITGAMQQYGNGMANDKIEQK